MLSVNETEIVERILGKIFYLAGIPRRKKDRDTPKFTGCSELFVGLDMTSCDILLIWSRLNYAK